MVEKITVVRDDDRRAFPLRQIPFEPFNGFDVEMIGRLIEQEQIWIRQQQTRQMRARALSAREVIERHVIFGFAEAQACEHLLDLDRIRVSAAPLELMLHASIPDQSLIAG
jgi:hypothetical protein